MCDEIVQQEVADAIPIGLPAIEYSDFMETYGVGESMGVVGARAGWTTVGAVAGAAAALASRFYVHRGRLYRGGTGAANMAARWF